MPNLNFAVRLEFSTHMGGLKELFTIFMPEQLSHERGISGRMKEIVFIQLNKERWKEFEGILKSETKVSSDKLSSLFIQLTDDLSWARTYYSGSSIVDYLNQLTQDAHSLIYRNKRVKRGSLLNFFVKEYPLLVYRSFPHIGWSFLIFGISLLIGCISVLRDDSFARLIMGDQYINMTLANIDKGDPLGVYKQMLGTDMFLAISFNNILVAFYAFVSGIFIGVGTAYALFNNGIMLGTFITFMVQKGVPASMILSIWVHGTLEIFAIIIAGAAGLILGSSILFPGSYTRSWSFRQGVLNGLRLAAGLVPMFLIAGFLEGYVTRYSTMPLILKLAIVAGSTLFILFYFFIYPIVLNKKQVSNQ
jgi:uncharacterized membrane protein SpoIIM required for sporulation